MLLQVAITVLLVALGMGGWLLAGVHGSEPWGHRDAARAGSMVEAPAYTRRQGMLPVAYYAVAAVGALCLAVAVWF